MRKPHEQRVITKAKLTHLNFMLKTALYSSALVVNFVYKVPKLSLSMVILNGRDCYENVRLPKNMHLEKQPFKNHNTINQLQLYWYNTDNAITSFKVTKCC